MDKNFTVEDTKIIKGVAIILMLMHHLWISLDRLNGNLISNFTIFGESSINYIGWFGQICVSIFFFLGGYGLYMCSKKYNFNIIERIKKLFISYWKVFLIFIPIAFIFFNNQIVFNSNPYVFPKYNFFDLKEVLTNFIGMSSSLNGEWWFFQSYIYLVFLFPFFKKLFEKFSDITNVFIVIIIGIMITNVFPAIGSIPEIGYLNNNFLYRTIFTPSIYSVCFLMGIVFSKGNLLVKLKNCINDICKLNFIIDIFGVILIVFLRQTVIGDSLDIFYVPLFIIFTLDLVKKIGAVKKLLSFLGNNSTNMWLIHSFLCYYFFPVSKFIISSNSAILSLLILIILSLLLSLIVDYFWKGISFIYIKCKNALKKKIS